MTKAATIAVRLKPELKEALEKMAEEDVRTLSSLIEKLLTDAARKSGYYGTIPRPGPNEGRD